MLSSNCVIAGISLVFLIGCLLHLHENDIFATKVIKKFKRLIYVIMFETVVDAAFMLLEGQAISRLILYFIKSSELFINPVIAFLVLDIFYDKETSEQDQIANSIRKSILLAIFANGALQIVGFFSGQIFYIDKDNLYHRGDLMFLYIIILVLTILVLMYGIFIFSSHTQSAMKSTLCSFALVLNMGIFLRGIFSNTNYDFLCMAVSILFLLIYYSHVTLRPDPVTQLLNRQVYSKLLEKIDYTTIIIMIDVNDFKKINDTYGHEAGDRALKQLAQIIYRAYGEHALCFRLGGDEFCAILKPGAFERLVDEAPQCDDNSVAEDFTQRLDNLLAQTNGDEIDYLKRGVSQGYEIFYETENIPIEEVIRLADKKMYRNKHTHKRQRK